MAALYFSELRLDRSRPDWPDRDRFVLSKGHACPVVYAALALRGYFPISELWTLRQLGSRLQGHPDMLKTPGVDMTTGSLGQGLSAGVGMALGLKLDNLDAFVYVVLGDGELDEGQIWEAAMAAYKYKLDNLITILDYNNLQLDGTCDVVMPIEPIPDKWRAFNWEVLEIDGHNIEEVMDAYDKAETIRGKPTVILAHTVKGKGVSFFENKVEYHGSAPTEDELTRALKEFGESDEEATS